MKAWVPSVFDLIALLLFLGLLFVGPPPGGDPGVFWHLKTGSWIAENAIIPLHDPFLFTTADRLWIADQWLSDLFLFNVFQFGGWPLLHLLTIGIAVGAYAIIVTATVRKETHSLMLQCFVTLTIAMLGGVQWFTRPVIFAFVFFASTYWIIWSYSKNPNPSNRTGAILWLLPPLFLLWANMHPSFLLGYAICGILGLHAIINCPIEIRKSVVRQLCLVGLCSAGVSYFTPFGFQLYTHILDLIQDPFFMSLNLEWQSPDFQHIAFRPFWVFLISLILLTASVGRGKSTITDWLLLSVFLAYALLHRRYIPFLGIVAAVPLTCVLETARLKLQESRLLPAISRMLSIKAWESCHGLVFLLVFGLCWAYTGVFGHVPFQTAEHSGPHPSYPWKALAHTKTLLPDPAAIPVKVFATPNWGGAITWTLWPNAKAFIDDRNSLNGRTHYEDFFTLNNFGTDWEKVLDKYNFDVLILAPQSAAANALLLTKKWSIRYRDAKAIVLMRR